MYRTYIYSPSENTTPKDNAAKTTLLNGSILNTKLLRIRLWLWISLLGYNMSLLKEQIIGCKKTSFLLCLTKQCSQKWTAMILSIYWISTFFAEQILKHLISNAITHIYMYEYTQLECGENINGKHHWPLVRKIHLSPVNSLHHSPVKPIVFPLMI